MILSVEDPGVDQTAVVCRGQAGVQDPEGPPSRTTVCCTGVGPDDGDVPEGTDDLIAKTP